MSTTEELIAIVRLRARLPDSAVSGTADADIIKFLNEDMMSRLLPAVIKPKEDHLLRTYRVTLVSGTARYRIPHRAAGLRLKSVDHVDSAGVRTPVKRVSKSRMSEYGTQGSGTPPALYLEGPWLVLVPGQGTTYTGSLEITFYMRPGNLVKASSYRKVAAVVSTTEITLDQTAPASWVAGSLYDVHSPNSGGEVRCWGRSLDTLDGTQVIFSTAIDGTVFGDDPVQVGDYFVVAGTAAVPALPDELHIPLAISAAASISIPMNPEVGMLLEQRFVDALGAAGYTIDYRMESSPPKAGKSNPLYGGRTVNTLR